MKILALPTQLILLTLSTQTLALSVGEYVQKGIVIPRPDEAPIPVAEPVPAPHDEPTSSGGGSSGSGEDPVYGNPATEGGLTGGGGTEGGLTSGSVNDIPYEPAPSSNPCLSSESCEDVTEDLAKEIIDKISDLIQNLPTSDASSATTSFIASPTGFATNTSATRTAVYPNADIATAIISTGLSQPYMALLDSSEQQLYVEQPVCFFANVVRMYWSIASQTATPTARRRDASSTIAATATAAIQSSFFATDLPSQVLSVYSATETGSMGTYATTCTGFDGGEVYTTSYVQRAVVSATSVPTYAVAQTGGAVGRNGGIGALLLAAFGSVGLMLYS